MESSSTFDTFQLGAFTRGCLQYCKRDVWRFVLAPSASEAEVTFDRLAFAGTKNNKLRPDAIGPVRSVVVHFFPFANKLADEVVCDETHKYYLVNAQNEAKGRKILVRPCQWVGSHLSGLGNC